MPYSIKVFETRFNPGTNQSGTHGSMNTKVNINPDMTQFVLTGICLARYNSIPLVMIDEAWVSGFQSSCLPVFFLWLLVYDSLTSCSESDFGTFCCITLPVLRWDLLQDSTCLMCVLLKVMLKTLHYSIRLQS